MKFSDLFKRKPQAVPQAEAKPAEAATTKENTQATAEAAAPQTDTQATGSKVVHNLILIDESGSMSSIYRPALTGMNETLQTIRQAQAETPDQKQLVTLVAFDSGHYNEIYRNTPAEKAIDITEEQYRPCACTPLYDAMGRSLTDLEKSVGDKDIVLVTIITDGYENASHEYNLHAIKKLVERLKADGWVFAYIGANQDVDQVADSLAINNRMAFQTDDESTRIMFEKERRSRKAFLDKSYMCANRSQVDQDGYFDA